MRDDYTHITFVLDKSGSMSSVETDTIGAVNKFIDEQAALPGKCTFTLCKFNHTLKLEDTSPIAETPRLTKENYGVGGNTALLDAIGRSIDQTGAELSKLAEAGRPGKVVFVILTDGLENASQEFNNQKIREMIQHQQDVYSWQFLFLGANQDAFANAGSMGISQIHTTNYSHSHEGSAAVMDCMSANVASYRAGASLNAGFSVEQQAKMDELKSRLGK